jgi:hypothetical protein
MLSHIYIHVGRCARCCCFVCNRLFGTHAYHHHHSLFGSRNRQLRKDEFERTYVKRDKRVQHNHVREEKSVLTSLCKESVAKWCDCPVLQLQQRALLCCDWTNDRHHRPTVKMAEEESQSQSQKKKKSKDGEKKKKTGSITAGMEMTKNLLNSLPSVPSMTAEGAAKPFGNFGEVTSETNNSPYFGQLNERFADTTRSFGDRLAYTIENKISADNNMKFYVLIYLSLFFFIVFSICWHYVSKSDASHSYSIDGILFVMFQVLLSSGYDDSIVETDERIIYVLAMAVG